MGAKGVFKEICLRGHIKTSHGNGVPCKECLKITQKAWSVENRERLKKYSAGYYQENIIKRHEVAASNYRKNKVAILQKQKRARSNGNHPSREREWAQYGIVNPNGTRFTIQDYDKSFRAQGGLCAGCMRPQSKFKKRLYADHDHLTGFFRGLLCFQCNFILGLCHDDETVLANLVEYVFRGKSNF